MKRVLIILASLLALLFIGMDVATADDADDAVAQSASKFGRPFHWLGLQQETASHGSYSIVIDYSIPGPSPIGTLINCTGQPSEIVLQVRGTFDFFAGICDDFDGPPCDNKLIYVTEGCEGVTDGEQVYRIRSDFARSKMRICYDEYLTGQCNELEEVARGYVTAQNQGLVVDGVIQAPARQFGVRTITDSKWFRFDGRWVRIPRTGIHVNVLFDMPEPDGCDAILNPCGFAESGVGIRR